ncbi:hypothetical protein HELRODRAFT_174856 [Helobdella robusta]|uniref:Uncharacterized protein n=1 Tax=Helobdella robusta TaxID=6412 RepID=T1F8J6_HELRO|nr:hypothetical protein HELRODRAFT_174856 [Helobdella robusta]ESO01304.1 hypothetical protein HELRODRAFT_174856 [Helobdella robusta]
MIDQSNRAGPPGMYNPDLTGMYLDGQHMMRGGLSDLPPMGPPPPEMYALSPRTGSPSSTMSPYPTSHHPHHALRSIYNPHHHQYHQGPMLHPMLLNNGHVMSPHLGHHHGYATPLSPYPNTMGAFYGSPYPYPPQTPPSFGIEEPSPHIGSNNTNINNSSSSSGSASTTGLSFRSVHNIPQDVHAR